MCPSRKHNTDCKCTTLQNHYGNKLYQCTYPSCERNREGYHTRTERERHIQNHNLPWKCSEASCPWAVTGFATRRGRDEHWIKQHQDTKLPLQAVNTSELSRDEIQIMVFESIKAGDIDTLRKVAPLASWLFITQPAMILAAKVQSIQMLDVLCACQSGEAWLQDAQAMQQLARVIIESEDQDVFSWLLRKIEFAKQLSSYGFIAGPAFATKSEDVYAEWEDYLLDPSRLLCTGAENYGRPPVYDYYQPASSLIPQFEKRSILFSETAFKATKKSEILELRLIQTWHRLIDTLGGTPLDPQFLGWSLTCLARTSHSIQLAAELLRLGAPVNYPHGDNCKFVWPKKKVRRPQRPQDSRQRGRETKRRRQTKRRGMTALHCASRFTTEKAAYFVRFLLENGADTERGWEGALPAHEKGIPLMKKWVGETWEEITERTAQKREEQRNLYRNHELKRQTNSEDYESDEDDETDEEDQDITGDVQKEIRWSSDEEDQDEEDQDIAGDGKKEIRWISDDEASQTLPQKKRRITQGE